MKKKLVGVTSLLLSVSVMPSPYASEVHWSYEGTTGPEFWATLDAEFALCGSGLEQSPIDIRKAKDKRLSPLNIQYTETPLEVINNGHTIQVNVEPGHNMLSFEGREYQLKQFHFHTPSEHKENGRNAPMEVHFVNVSAAGEIAVIGVFLKEKSENDTLKTIFSYAPTAEGEQIVPEVKIDITELLPADEEEFYHYKGSLTTPPCSEGLNWFVMDDPVYVSAEQVEFFQSIFHANARPVQPLNDRIVYESED